MQIMHSFSSEILPNYASLNFVFLMCFKTLPVTLTTPLRYLYFMYPTVAITNKIAMQKTMKAQPIINKVNIDSLNPGFFVLMQLLNFCSSDNEYGSRTRFSKKMKLPYIYQPKCIPSCSTCINTFSLLLIMYVILPRSTYCCIFENKKNLHNYTMLIKK